jgi:uncharacterized Ntn-hydrolase superfamily protein
MTYTIAARDRRTDQNGLCMTTVSAACGAIGKYYAEKAETVLSCQAYAEYGSSSRLADFLDDGGSFSDFIRTLEETDEFLSYKQIGIVRRNGNIEAYTGSNCKDWAGHIIGEDYVVFGNVLAGEHVAKAMADAFESSREHGLDERLLLSIEAGQNAGGQNGYGQSMPELSTMLRVYDYRADPLVFANGRLPVLDLRVDLDVDPIAKLRRIHKPIASLMEVYKKRYGRNPVEYLDSAPVIPELAMHANQF